MSIEEDTELRDLISQTLEANGCFAKIRAQLRASVFLALDGDDTFQEKKFSLNKRLYSTLETFEGKLMLCIVREFLEHLNLEFTISVFEPESHMGSNYEYTSRQKLIQDLDIPGLNQESPDSVLLQLIQLCTLNNRSSTTQNTVPRLNYKNDIISHNDCNDKNIVNDKTSKFTDSVHCNILNETYDVEDFAKNETYLGNRSEESNSTNTESSALISLKEKLLIDFDNSITENVLCKNNIEKNESPIEQSALEDFSPPIVKDIKHSKLDSSFEKLKLPSTKGDKSKVKNNLSSLSDLPPLQTSKSRTNDMLLPSLYTKEFKDKTGIKELDKLFELEALDNYEEDFISESEIDLTLNKPDVAGGLQHETSEKGVKPNTSLKETEVSYKTKLALDSSNSTGSSVTSEDFEMNSNIDDILNSC